MEVKFVNPIELEIEKFFSSAGNREAPSQTPHVDLTSDESMDDDSTDQSSSGPKFNPDAVNYSIDYFGSHEIAFTLSSHITLNHSEKWPQFMDVQSSMSVYYSAVPNISSMVFGAKYLIYPKIKNMLVEHKCTIEKCHYVVAADGLYYLTHHRCIISKFDFKGVSPEIWKKLTAKNTKCDYGHNKKCFGDMSNPWNPYRQVVYCKCAAELIVHVASVCMFATNCVEGYYKK